jgi:hypothetical protein
MARSAAAKKVAKAASTGAGGKGVQQNRNVMFPVAMALVAVLGIALIFVARDRRAGNAPEGDTGLNDHWHSAYNIYVCDEISPVAYPDDSDEDLTGIHSHGDGLMHIHPFVSTVSGQFATVGAFMREIEVEFDDSTLELPNGTILRESDFTCGTGDDAAPAELRVLKWNTLDAETPIVFTEDLADVRLNENGQLFVFAMVDPSTEDDDIPRPDDAFLRDYIGQPAEDLPVSEPDAGTGPEVPAGPEGSGDETDSGSDSGDEPATGPDTSDAGSSTDSEE